MAERVPVIAISHHQASTSQGVPIAAVIHHGVDVAAFPGGAGTGGYAAFLGRMSHNKGVDVAIRVAKRAGLRLVIAAKMREDAELEYYRDHIAPMLGGGVEYIGEIGGADKLELLAGARFLLNPIRWPEPFGLVMIEALACGTPVITMNEGSACEIVDDEVNGFVCTTEDELVDAVGRVDAIDRSRCQSIAKERFSADRMVADHLELFREVINAKKGLAEKPIQDYH